ncbi:MAG: cysteine-rich small domain-containing protein [Clostridia bacterium]|nr:cysteine-rich small domain-containing protein [Clostridia bacterium]
MYSMAEKKHFRFFQNKQCEFFPCHEGVPEEDFNCLFCYCPLYALGRKCGGSCKYLENGTKDCSGCTFPHRRDNYYALLNRYEDIVQVVRKMDEEK